MKVDRIEKARFIAKNGYTKVAHLNAAGQITNVYVPGSGSKMYEVIIRRNGHISTECLLKTGSGHLNCKGNSIVVCYHSWSALIEVARENDMQITAICKTQAAADLRARMGGKISEVKSEQGGKSMWMVVEPLS